MATPQWMTRQYALLDLARWQDAQIKRITERLARMGEPDGPQMAPEGEWYATAKGVGHGHPTRTVRAMRPTEIIRTVGDRAGVES